MIKCSSILRAALAIAAASGSMTGQAAGVAAAKAMPKSTELEVGSLLPINDLPEGWDTQVGSAVAPFRFGLRARAAIVKSKGFAKNWGTGMLLFTTTRLKSQRRAEGIMSFNSDRFSIWAQNAGLVEDVSRHDSLLLNLSVAQERRRPSFSVAAHNAYTTKDTAITLAWTHEEQFRLGLSLYSITPNGARSAQERIVELAGGAPLSASGLAFAASFWPTNSTDNFSLGFDLRSQRLGHNDAGLIGADSGRNDARLGFFLRKTF